LGRAFGTGVAGLDGGRGGSFLSTSYERDFYTWSQEQAAFLRQGRLDLLDLENLAEEVESMGKSERREFVSRLSVIICHLLKLQVQVDRASANEKSWKVSVRTQRAAVAKLLNNNPGLKNPAILADALDSGWSEGLDLAIRETGLDADLFPTEIIFSLAQVLDDAFWP